MALTRRIPDAKISKFHHGAARLSITLPGFQNRDDVFVIFRGGGRRFGYQKTNGLAWLLLKLPARHATLEMRAALGDTASSR